MNAKKMVVSTIHSNIATLVIQQRELSFLANSRVKRLFREFYVLHLEEHARGMLVEFSEYYTCDAGTCQLTKTKTFKNLISAAT